MSKRDKSALPAPDVHQPLPDLSWTLVDPRAVTKSLSGAGAGRALSEWKLILLNISHQEKGMKVLGAQLFLPGCEPIWLVRTRPFSQENQETRCFPALRLPWCRSPHGRAVTPMAFLGGTAQLEQCPGPNGMPSRNSSAPGPSRGRPGAGQGPLPPRMSPCAEPDGHRREAGDNQRLNRRKRGKETDTEAATCEGWSDVAQGRNGRTSGRRRGKKTSKQVGEGQRGERKR